MVSYGACLATLTISISFCSCHTFPKPPTSALFARPRQLAKTPGATSDLTHPGGRPSGNRTHGGPGRAVRDLLSLVFRIPVHLQFASIIFTANIWAVTSINSVLCSKCWYVSCCQGLQMKIWSGFGRPFRRHTVHSEPPCNRDIATSTSCPCLSEKDTANYEEKEEKSDTWALL